jgi:hypothetical protein
VGVPPDPPQAGEGLAEFGCEVHGTIALVETWEDDPERDDAELPVTHRTRREGSPHKLVLTKTAELHRRDTERRQALATALEAIEQFSTQP